MGTYTHTPETGDIVNGDLHTHSLVCVTRACEDQTHGATGDLRENLGEGIGDLRDKK